MAFIFWLSSRPSPEELKMLPIFAKLKLVHIIEYGFLYFLFWWALIKTTTFKWYEIFALALGLTVIYGLTDEFHQIYVVGRTARLADVVADGVGGLLAQGIILIIGKFRRQD
jgi:VanZ family protein